MRPLYLLPVIAVLLAITANAATVEIHANYNLTSATLYYYDPNGTATNIAMTVNGTVATATVPDNSTLVRAFLYYASCSYTYEFGNATAVNTTTVNVTLPACNATGGGSGGSGGGGGLPWAGITPDQFKLLLAGLGLVVLIMLAVSASNRR